MHAPVGHSSQYTQDNIRKLHRLRVYRLLNQTAPISLRRIYLQVIKHQNKDNSDKTGFGLANNGISNLLSELMRPREGGGGGQGWNMCFLNRRMHYWHTLETKLTLHREIETESLTSYFGSPKRRIKIAITARRPFCLKFSGKESKTWKEKR